MFTKEESGAQPTVDSMLTDILSDEIKVEVEPEQKVNKSNPSHEESEEDVGHETEEDEDDDGVEESETEEGQPKKKTYNLDDTDEEFELTINGEKVVVSGNELRSGYWRQQSFTQKTQELAAQRKEAESQLEQVKGYVDNTLYAAKQRISEIEKVVEMEGGLEAMEAKYGKEKMVQLAQVYKTARQQEEQIAPYLAQIESQRTAIKEAELENTFKTLQTNIKDFNVDTAKEMYEFAQTQGLSEKQLETVTD